MDCRKKKYCLDEVLEKVAAGKDLDYCEEICYLMHLLGITEVEAEQVLAAPSSRES